MNNENSNTVNNPNEGENTIQEETQQVKCHHCGETIEIHIATEASDTGNYFCPDCVNDLYTCDDCGAHIENNYGNHEISLCESCREDYTECDHCGELIHEDNLDTVRNYNSSWRGTEEQWCESCREDSASYCEWCENYVHGISIEQATNGYMVCERCAEDEFHWCDECGELMHRHDSYWNEYEERYCCESCSNSRSRTVKNYGYKPSPQFLGEDSKLYLGVELEVGGAGYSDSKDAANSLYSMGGDDSLFTMKEDSSIPSSGFEIVTQPATYKYHKDEFPWEDIMKTCRSNGLRGHDLGDDSCGMHIHCSRDYMPEVRWAAFEFFLTRTQKQWIKIARRNPSHWGGVQRHRPAW